VCTAHYIYRVCEHEEAAGLQHPRHFCCRGPAHRRWQFVEEIDAQDHCMGDGWNGDKGARKKETRRLQRK